MRHGGFSDQRLHMSQNPYRSVVYALILSRPAGLDPTTSFQSATMANPIIELTL